MKKILIVVDMQNDFIDGALGTAEAKSIVKNVQKKILSYEKEDVYATLDTHTKEYLTTQEGKYLPVAHCIKGTEGWNPDKEIKNFYRLHTPPGFFVFSTEFPLKLSK